MAVLQSVRLLGVGAGDSDSDGEINSLCKTLDREPGSWCLCQIVCEENIANLSDLFE